MEDNDVCPLCCEELDISDQQFFPCKCGYQVCMWCWHRIKEQESGNCPACRTPYGDDPHEFSAVDMEEVVKANKAKAAAEKRERERLRQEQAANNAGGSRHSGPGGAGSNLGNMHIGGGSDGDLAVAMTASGSGRGQFEPPKDRSQLANMRVIRRNLVYAVGLPPSIATEDTLRKPEYFGQYGKIAKIVINRNHHGNGDPRRATASAYVTFAHPDDTLACILALDGFYHEGRNIRASYGTSKYCSAFIKNVRCNNPDCTYLHCMGDSIDTFTKQEIQAGYVTSGRDVLAKQQQMAQNTGAKRRVGGGGPSGTGRVPSTPIFPAPTFDEPPKPPTAALVNAPGAFPPVGNPSLSRSVSASVTGFSSVAAGTMSPSKASMKASVAAGKLPARSVSMSATTAATPSTAVVTGLPTAGSKVGKSKKKDAAQKLNTKAAAKATGPTSKPATAASVVAGLRSTKSTTAQPPAHSTLTSLTPLTKKAGGNKSSVSSTGEGKSVYTASSGNSSKGHTRNDSVPDAVNLPSDLRVPATSSMSDQQQDMTSTSNLGAIRPRGELPAVGSIAAAGPAVGINGGTVPSAGTIGGSVIGSAKPIGSPGAAAGRGGLGAIGDSSIIGGGTTSSSPQGLGSIGGSAFGGQPIPMAVGGGSVIGAPSRGNDAMGDALLTPVGLGVGRAVGPSGTAPGGSSSVIGGGTIGSNPFASGAGDGKRDTALASMLGIQLPTGSGSLRESSSLWESSPAPAPVGSSNGTGMAPGPIGGPARAPGGLVIGGGAPAGTSNSTGGVAIGGFHGNGTSASAVGSNTNDIALLQTLLPGVRITAGESSQQPSSTSAIGGGIIGGGADWGSGIGGAPQQQQSIGGNQGPLPIGGLGGLQQQPQQQQQQQQGLGGGDTWGAGGLYRTNVGAAQQQQQQHRPANIW